MSESHAFWRLRQLRTLRRMTLENLAARTGLTKSYVSKLERGASTPSIATALKLAGAFGLSVGELFGLEGESSDYAVIRKSARKSYNRKGQKVEAIAPGLREPHFQAFIIQPRRSEPPGIPDVRHPGQELLYVMRGTLGLSFPGTSIELAEGDAIIFDGQLPHRLISIGSKRAEALVVITNEKAQP